MEYAGLSVAGPNSRALLQQLVNEDLSNDAYPFMSFRPMDVGMIPALVGRVSFTGDLGYEIWVTADYQRALYDRLVAAGRPFALRPFGGRALNAMRLEKSFGTWAREYRPIYGPYEAGLGRFVDLARNDLVGRGRAAGKRTRRGCRPPAGDVHGRCRRCRRDRRRAGVARRQGGRLDHLWRLCPRQKPISGAGRLSQRHWRCNETGLRIRDHRPAAPAPSNRRAAEDRSKGLRMRANVKFVKRSGPLRPSGTSPITGEAMLLLP